MTQHVSLGGRTFQFWRFSPSFQTLLLMSTKEMGHPSRMAILFSRTKRIDMQTFMSIEDIRFEGASEDRSRHFELRGATETGSVSAVEMLIEEDDLAFDAENLFDRMFSTSLAVAKPATRRY